MKFFFASICAALCFLCIARADQAATLCNQAKLDSVRLVEIRPGFHRVEGELASFDPCHDSVQLAMPVFFARKLGVKPPLMLIAHGGNGPGAAELEMVRRMNAHGVATLLFDAYELNGFRYRGTSLFLTGVTNESRQRMILKAAWGAYRWALLNPDIDSSRIFIYGLSNGGSVALNLAALVDPQHVRMVFAEGAPSAGIGMPDRLRVPLTLVFGKLDNYGGRKQDDWMHLRTEPCALNRVAAEAAPGTAQRCNWLVNPSERGQSPQSWAEQVQAQGQPLSVWFYEGAAHGLLFGALERGSRTYGSGPSAQERFGWVGASPEAAAKFIDDVMVTIHSTYR